MTDSAAPMQPRSLVVHGSAHGRLVPAAKFHRLPKATDNYPTLNFRDIYATIGVIGLRIGDRARDLAGQPVRIRGYMAPPILGEADFFVLTRSPVVTCPFCDPGANWPDDVVLALLERSSRFIDPAQPIEVAGELDIGARLDPFTGTVRLVRLGDARWQPVGA
jgi:hypothetical protein